MDFDYFVSLIYVTDTEEQAVLRMHDWKEKRFDDDDQLYREATFERDGKIVKISCAKQIEMGMTCAATLTMKLISHYRPQYLVMPGIAAGVGMAKMPDQFFGDVLLADAVWNYSNGKYVPPSKAEVSFGNIGFIPRPAVVHVDDDLIPIFREAMASEDNQCFVHLGFIACGTSVVANEDVVGKLVLHQFTETTGLEMESYGVAFACREAIRPKPKCVIAKSICDFANSEKNDNYQKFASYTSCEFCKFLYTKYLPFR